MGGKTKKRSILKKSSGNKTPKQFNGDNGEEAKDDGRGYYNQESPNDQYYLAKSPPDGFSS